MLLQSPRAVARPNDKEKIRDHYNRVSPYYYSLWGEHLHHGYWIEGQETKEQAQVQLIEHLAEAAGIANGSRILDVGCGFGGSSIFLAKRYNAHATGITISPIQVEMAGESAAREKVSADFLLMDAEVMHFDEQFDVIWSVESISHYEDVAKFFASAVQFLKPGGTLALLDWFKKKKLSPRAHRKALLPLEKGMLVELHTMAEYQAWLRTNGLNVVKCETLNGHCAKTWDLCLDIIKDKNLWLIAAQNGPEFVRFLRAFSAMRRAYASGQFVYGLLVARKPG
jgi:cyclopropane fatty-acyl-phospholipid synthase-like methyltransferase